MGCLKSLCRTYYRSSIETVALNYVVFEEIAFFVCILATDGQTDRRTASMYLRHSALGIAAP